MAISLGEKVKDQLEGAKERMLELGHEPTEWTLSERNNSYRNDCGKCGCRTVVAFRRADGVEGPRSEFIHRGGGVKRPCR